jgi:hypothetical protein
MIASLFIIGVNTFLKVVIRRFSLFEKHDTYTSHNISVAFKLTLARFINSAIVPLLINRQFDDWNKDGGLASKIFFLTISISFVDPFLYLINIPYQIKKVKR